jgi:hypothetical protein
MAEAVGMLRIVDAEGVSAEAIGRIVPWGFGQNNQVAAIPLCVGARDVLAEAVESNTPSTGGALQLSIPDAVRRFPSAGIVQIEAEIIAYTGRDIANARLTGIVRGANGTAAAAHSLGIFATEVKNTHTYVIAHNLSSQYRHQSVNAVYINGVRKPNGDAPVTTVDTDDQTSVPGTTVVSLKFDLNTINWLSAPQFIEPTSLQQLQAFNDFRSALDTAIQGDANALSGYAPTQTIDSSYVSGGATNQRVTNIYRPPAGAGSAIVTLDSLSSPSVSFSLSRPAAVRVSTLGSVTADLTGLQDDDAGTVTGTPNELLTNPADIVKTILIHAYNVPGANIDGGSFAVTGAKQDDYGIRWDFMFDAMPLSDFIGLAGLQGLADLFVENRLWRYIFRQRTSVPGFAVFSDYFLLSDPKFSWTSVRDLISEMNVVYQGFGQTANLLVTSEVAQDRYGTRPSQLNLPWIRAKTVAETLGTYWLHQSDHPILYVDVDVPWVSLPVGISDMVELPIPFMASFGSKRVPFRVRAVSYDLNARVMRLSLSEDTPTGLTLSGAYALQVLSLLGAPTLMGRYHLVAAQVIAPDSLAIVFATETAEIDLLIPQSDTLSVGFAENADIVIGTSLIDSVDSLAVTMTEGAAFIVQIIASADTLAVQMVEGSEIQNVVGASETLPLGFTESTGLTIICALTETLPLGWSETGVLSITDHTAGPINMVQLAPDGALNIRPDGTTEWEITNVYREAGISLRQIDADDELELATASGAGVQTNLAFRVTNTRYLRIVNTDSVPRLVGHDGNITKA